MGNVLTKFKASLLWFGKRSSMLTAACDVIVSSGEDDDSIFYTKSQITVSK